MAVPGFQEMFLPFLQSISDGTARHHTAIRQYIEDKLQISPEDRAEMLPSGQSTKVANRVGWSRTHLSKAGLIVTEKPGVFRISDEGKKLLSNPPPKLDMRFLETFPAYYAWRHASGAATPPLTTGQEIETALQAPNERIEEAFSQLNDSLASELQVLMAKMDPFRFEQLVVDLLFAMGYGGSREEAAKVTKKSNDEGIDGVINEDRLGLDVIYVQAKRWQNTVGRKEIQSFVGALAGQQANKGVFITTSDFAQTGTDYAKSVQQKVILIDGTRLAELMVEHNIGVTTTRTISLKRIDSDYFEEN
jgi:restriction system protein